MLSLGIPCAGACRMNLHGSRQAASLEQINADDCERSMKEHPDTALSRLHSPARRSGIDTSLLKDIVKDTLWITVLYL